jgi:aminopeptidase YwaD
MRFYKLSFLVVACLCIHFSCTAQYAQETIKKLTAPNFHGRGYYKSGDHIAANFIQSEFISAGLKPVNGTYRQPFAFPVNTFPGKVNVSIGTKKLTPGKDFIVSPACPSVKGTFRLVNISLPLPDFTARDYSNDLLLIDKFGLDSLSTAILDSLIKFPPLVKGVVVIDPVKLTWSVSQRVNDKIYIRALRDSFPKNATTIKLNIENKFIENYATANVVGYVPGKVYPDSFIVFTAHYDHLGRMGKKTIFPGANDNASGTAMIMDLARLYAKPENQPDMSVMFIAFAGEEAGLVGSKYYTEHPLVPIEKIRFLLNLDLMGNGEDGVMVVNGEIHATEFGILDSINNSQKLLKTVGKRGTAKNSDHYWFSNKGVPAFFLYTTGGSKAYHDIYDTANQLPLTEFEDVKTLLIDFVQIVGK